MVFMSEGNLKKSWKIFQFTCTEIIHHPSPISQGKITRKLNLSVEAFEENAYKMALYYGL